MKNLTLLILVTLSFASGSTAFAAKDVFEPTKPHLNVGTIGNTDTTGLTLAIALAAENQLEEAIDGRTGTVTAVVETEHYKYEIDGSDGGESASGKPSEAFFVKVDRSTTTQAQTREHILLARQVGVPVVVFLNVDGFKDPREIEALTSAIHELLHGLGYTRSNSGVVVGSVESALKGEEGGLRSLIDLFDTLDRCLGH